jgi:hypothetical protein
LNISSPTTTHFDGADGVGGNPLAVLPVGYGNGEICIEVERTKGPVGPVVEYVDQVLARAFSFKSGRG